nr:JmjC domain-containing protein [Tanacetum cinerariifolium]
MPILPAMLATLKKVTVKGLDPTIAAATFTNVEDEPLGGSFYMSPPRSTQSPPVSQTSSSAEDPITLIVLSSVVSTLVQKMVVSDSDQEKEGKQDVDLDALRALANAAMTIDSNIPPGGASNNPTTCTSVTAAVPIGASTVPTGSLSVPVDVLPSVAPAGVLNKGKSLIVEKDITVKERTFKQMQEDILVSRLPRGYMMKNKLKWTDKKQSCKEVEANASLSKILLGDDVSKENFPARMAALIKRKKQALAEKLAKERRNRTMTQAQQRTYMRELVKNQSCAIYSTGWSMIQAFSQTLKRTGPMLEEPSSKRQKSTEAPIPSLPDDPQSPVVSSPPSYGTRRKSLGRKHLPKPKSTLQELDLDADTQTFITIVSTEDSDDKAPFVWSALVGWEVLFESHEGGKGSFVWKQQHLWQIRSWRLYTLSNVHILETISGEVLYMFMDVCYPLSVKLMERMLTHKLEIDTDVVGNDMTTAEQLIQFIKNQLAAAQVSSI